MEDSKQVEQGLRHFPWFAIRAKPNFEKRVANGLRNKGFEEFLPLYQTRRRWSDRLRTVDCPLFPGYVFCRLNVEHRLPVMTTPGFLYIVSAGSIPAPVNESEVAAIQAVVCSGLHALPWPYSVVGQRVRLEDGPLCGLEGILTRVASEDRMCVCVTLLNRSVSVRVNRQWIRPLTLSDPAEKFPLKSQAVNSHVQAEGKSVEKGANQKC